MSELILLVLRMQADTEQLRAALAAHDSWQNCPGDNANYCARVLDNIAFDLTGLRDTLRAEQRAQAGEEGGR